MVQDWLKCWCIAQNRRTAQRVADTSRWPQPVMRGGEQATKHRPTNCEPWVSLPPNHNLPDKSGRSARRRFRHHDVTYDLSQILDKKRCRGHHGPRPREHGKCQLTYVQGALSRSTCRALNTFSFGQESLPRFSFNFTFNQFVIFRLNVVPGTCRFIY